MSRDRSLQPAIADVLAMTSAPAVPLAIVDEPEGVDESLLEYVQNFASQPGAVGDEYTIEKSDALLESMAPRDTSELLLCSQIVALHRTGLQFLARGESTEAEPNSTELANPNQRKAWESKQRNAQQWASLGIRAVGALTKAVETLAKLRGQVSNQTVRVEHVTVADGGQAVIGNVGQGGHTTGGGE